MVDAGGLVTDRGVPSMCGVRRAMPSVLQEPICDAENDRRLDGRGKSQPAEGPAAEEPHGGGSRRFDAASGSGLEPPFHREIPHRRRSVHAEQRALHHAKHDEELSDDASGKCATGQEPRPPRAKLRRNADESNPRPRFPVARIDAFGACRAQTRHAPRADPLLLSRAATTTPATHPDLCMNQPSAVGHGFACAP